MKKSRVWGDDAYAYKNPSLWKTGPPAPVDHLVFREVRIQ